MSRTDMAIAPAQQDPEREPAPWRNILPIHSAANLFPRMNDNELRALGEDIKKNGLTLPITLWSDGKSPAQLLDGRNRLDAIERRIGPIEIGPPSLAAGKDFLAINKVIVLDKSIDPYAYVISNNWHHRHLNAEQKRWVLGNLIKAQPEKSDRQIAEMLKVDHKTVASVRTEMEGRGEIPHVETRTDTKGRQQPAKKVTTKPPPVSEQVLQQRAAAAERIRALPSGNKVDVTPESVSGNTSDEQSELRHFEFQAIALRSEIEELKTRIRDLEDRGLRAISLPTLLDEVEHKLPAMLPKKHLMALKALRGALDGLHVGATLNLDAIAINEETKH